MKESKINILLFFVLILGILSLFLEYGLYQTKTIGIITNVLDYCIIILFSIEILIRFIDARYKTKFIKNNLFDLILLTVLIILFIYTKYTSYLIENQKLQHLSTDVIIIRNIFILLKAFGRVRRLSFFLKSIAVQPAQTIVLSFLIVIIIGTILLMMPFSTSDNSRLGFINSLFTATSAVCVTGLIVVDTATKFSIYGKIIIMILIQIGGLGIMLLSYFTAFVIGRKVSLEDKIVASYLLSEQDMRKISNSVTKIILMTFTIELIGALLLFLNFSEVFGFNLKSIFFSLFHSVSAFCNAGFALFSDSFESFKSDLSINFIIVFLIILGGLSFSVLFNLADNLRAKLKSDVLKRQVRTTKLSLNAKAVMIVTGILVVSGMLIIYGFEHKNNLIHYDLKTQYLCAFFQSVTLRTAGFNTVDISILSLSTLLIMVVFMFIGGASGSTAGGVKVNTVFVTFSYIKSLFKGQSDVSIFKHSISRDLISKSFLIIILALVVVFLGTLFLSMTEDFEFERVLFEVVSAFGTVGLSTGITPSLSIPGRIVVIITMFIGRIGPMTLIAALSHLRERKPIRYPEGEILIG